LFHDTDLAAAKAERTFPVAATEPSDAVEAKKATKRSAEGQRVKSFADLMAHPGTPFTPNQRLSRTPPSKYTGSIQSVCSNGHTSRRNHHAVSNTSAILE
jgi:hypothetical protein